MRTATCDVYTVANQQRMTAGRALKWIGVSKAWQETCCLVYIAVVQWWLGNDKYL